MKAQAQIKTIDNGYMITWGKDVGDVHTSGQEYRTTKAEVIVLLREIFDE